MEKQNQRNFELIGDSKVHQRPSYAILGCGRLGAVLAQQLKSSGCDLILLDKDEETVRQLKNAGYHVIKGAMQEPSVIGMLNLQTLDGLLLLANDIVANTKALELIRQRSQDVFIAVRIEQEGDEAKVRKLTPDILVRPLQLAAVALADEIMKHERKARVAELVALLKQLQDSARVAIVLQDTPDPDSIASGMGLQAILESVDIPSVLIARGKVSHEENRAMVNLLNIDIRPYSEELVREFTQIALVDTAVAGENNPLPSGTETLIAIDHHATNVTGCTAKYADIRPDLGAASTILHEYMEELNLAINPILATALLYGIRSDTDEFRRNFTQQDFRAASRLYQLADPLLLKQIESPARSWETVDVLGNAIKNKVIKGTLLLSNIGFTTDKDALGQAADYLLKTEGITTTVIFGIIKDVIHVSARNTDIRLNIGQLLDQAFEQFGSAGGHRSMAGGQIPLGVFGGIKDKDLLVQLVGDAVVSKILAALGSEQTGDQAVTD